MLHLEFVGVPGAGKTTLRKALIGKLQEKGRACLGVPQALLLSLKRSREDTVTSGLLRILPERAGMKVLNSLFIRSPYRWIAQNRFLSQWGTSLEVILGAEGFQHMSLKERGSALSRFLRTAAEYQMIAEQSDHGVIVPFDEGFFQRATSLFLRPSAPQREGGLDLVSSYFDTVPPPDLLILVEADPEACLKRIQSRGLPGRLQWAGRSVVSRFLAQSQVFTDQVAAWAEKRNRPLVRIENDGPPHMAASSLCGMVLKALGSSSPAMQGMGDTVDQ